MILHVRYIDWHEGRTAILPSYTMNAAVRPTVSFLCLTGLLSCSGCSRPPTTPELGSLLQCSPTLWNRVYDPGRLQILDACRTVTGVIMDTHVSDDGDTVLPIAIDAAYVGLLNAENTAKLNGWLQVEVVCQANARSNEIDAIRACQDFAGSVPVPPVGTRVQVTGTYVLDHNHGWTEIHPVSVLTAR
jgi:hypothetical protein